MESSEFIYTYDIAYFILFRKSDSFYSSISFIIQEIWASECLIFSYYVLVRLCLFFVVTIWSFAMICAYYINILEAVRAHERDEKADLQL